MKIKLCADSSCDLPESILQQYDIAMLPLTVNMGEKTYKDGVDISIDTVFSYVDETGVLPKTAAGNVQEYLDFFHRWTDAGYEVVHVSVSSLLSSTCRNAVLAAEMMEHVHIIDSRDLCGGYALLLLRCADLIASGATVEEIMKDAEEYRERLCSSFVLNRLDYIHHGGRCTALEMLGANALRLKPCIQVRDGKLSTGKKYRGSEERATMQYVEDCMKNSEELDAHRIIFAHTNCSSEVREAAVSCIRSHLPEVEELIEMRAGCSIAAHCGPGTVAVFCARKEKRMPAV